MDISNLLKKDNIIAVLGASENREKYGYKIFVQLIKEGFETYPINLNSKKIYGRECYPNLQSLPKTPDLLITVVPPKITEKIIPIAKNLNIKHIWMQPGSESEIALELCKKYKLDCIYNLCYIKDGLKIEFKL